MIRVDTAWKRIERVLQEHAPHLRKALQGPATDTQIESLQRNLDRRLPADFLRSLRIHNGMSNSYLGRNRFFNYEALLSTKDILAQWRMMADLFADQSGGDPITKTRKIRNDRWWRGSWVPITDSDGDGFVLDLDPGSRGKRGQVLYFYHDGARPRRVVASSYREWLSRVADELAAGKFRVDGGAIWLDRLER